MFNSNKKKLQTLQEQFDLITNNPTVKSALKLAEMAQEKQKQYDALVGSDLNYTIIRDLINSAANGVVITITFKSGEKMTIERDTTPNLGNRNLYRDETF